MSKLNRLDKQSLIDKIELKNLKIKELLNQIQELKDEGFIKNDKFNKFIELSEWIECNVEKNYMENGKFIRIFRFNFVKWIKIAKQSLNYIKLIISIAKENYDQEYKDRLERVKEYCS